MYKIGRGRLLKHNSGVWLCIMMTIILVISNAECSASDSGKGHALTVVSTPEDGDATVSVEEDHTFVDDSIGEFQPTDEWQDVKEGQKLPAGLHVQMDFQTGRKQAKRMKSEDPKVERWDAGDKMGVIDTEKPRFTREQLKAALKDFKYQDITPPDEENEKKIKDSFRSYEELKKAMKDMKLAVKTEGEIVRELTAKLNNSEFTEDNVALKTILIDLEYYLHQVDNAQLFCDLGGMSAMMKLLNNTEEEIRGFASLAMGAALQSNVKVQVCAMQAGLISELLQHLSSETSVPARSRLLYALSALLRQFPAAQNSFLRQAGLTALTKLFKQAESESLQVKVITLLTDLLTENDINLNLSSSEDPVQVERTKQYKEVKLHDHMVSMGWCDLTPLPLQQQQTIGHDTVEKIVEAMSVLTDSCAAQFWSSRRALQALVVKYEDLAKEEQAESQEMFDDFFTNIHSSLEKLVGKIQNTREDL